MDVPSGVVLTAKPGAGATEFVVSEPVAPLEMSTCCVVTKSTSRSIIRGFVYYVKAIRLLPLIWSPYNLSRLVIVDNSEKSALVVDAI
jgi:hypothetical protein